MKTVLVSGAGGFLGKELVKKLIKNNYQVIALTSNKNYLINIFKNNPNINVLDINGWHREIKKNKIDTLFNCAFPRTSDPEQLAEGLNFTENLVKEALKLKVNNIVNISSQSVYTQKDKSLPDENATVAPGSLYGMTKFASEKIVAGLCKHLKTDYTNIRLASLTGPSLEQRMTNRFVKVALNGGEVTVNGTSQKISYLDVRDAASALVKMLEVDSNKWNSVYNLGSDYYNSVLEIVQIVNKVAVEYSVPGIEINLNQEQDKFNNLINSSLFYRHFNWIPSYGMNEIISNLFSYYSR